MGIKKFISHVKEFLSLDKSINSNKKKSIKQLLKKLKKRRVEVYKLIENASKEDKLILEEELEIISLHIKKGKDIFNNYVKLKKV